MSKSIADREQARMFVALELPERTLDEISEWGEQELADPALRRVPRDSLHITLAFLGDRPLEAIERIEGAMEDIAETPIFLELEGPVGLPRRGRPRLVALPVSSNPVVVRQRELAESLTHCGLYEPEARPFWPHVTVARVSAEGRGSSRPLAAQIPSGPSPTAGCGWFEAVRLSLYRSQPQSSGSQYVPLAQVELPSQGGSEVI